MSYALENKIYAGRKRYEWDNKNIVLNSASGVFSCDVIGNELSVDEFTVTVRFNYDAAMVYAPQDTNGGYLLGYAVLGSTQQNPILYVLNDPHNYDENYLKDIGYGEPIIWYVDGSVFAKGYFKSSERLGKYIWKITAMSGIGLLSAKTHVGGLYNGQTVETLLSSIIGTTFPFSVADDVKSVTVYGHLPYDTARANLHRLLFAVGAVLTKDATGNYQVAFPSTTMAGVPASRIALGGKTEYTTPADGVEITEHSFYALNSDEVVQLFDNTNGAAISGKLVLFDDPMHDLAVTGNLTIDESSVNHAVVSGVGTLTGKKYTHNSIIVKHGTGSSNIKRVTANELISFANSYYVAKRVMSYYASTRKITAKILLADEKPGQLLALRDSFGERTNAYLSQMNVSVTSVKMAQCKLIAGFQPGEHGNNFENSVIITADATWTVPTGVTRIRIVLIGGGQGGQGGYDGANGLDSTTDPGLVFGGQSTDYTESYWYYPNDEQPAASGGDPGQPGAKAAFLISDQSVSAGSTIAIVVGIGGNGGAHNGVEGDAGTPTTAQGAFGTISSDDGVSTFEGYNDPISGITYAVDGVAGVKGGDGGLTYPYGEIAPDGESVVGGYRGQNVATWRGGAGSNGAQWHSTTPMPSGLYMWMSSMAGAGGGGAANGSNGSGAANANYSDHWEQVHGYDIHVYDFNGGNGGNGADAVAPPRPTIYGQGGTGGNGGGAGGNAGGLSLWVHSDTDQSPTFNMHPGTGGTGGQGSSGGQGANGCAIIYY